MSGTLNGVIFKLWWKIPNLWKYQASNGSFNKKVYFFLEILFWESADVNFLREGDSRENTLLSIEAVSVADFTMVFLDKLAKLISQKRFYLEEQLFAIILNLTVIWDNPTYADTYTFKKLKGWVQFQKKNTVKYRYHRF